NERSSPVETANLTGVISIAAGDYTSLAIRSDGTLWVWGDLPGVGATTTPQQVTGLTGVTAIAGTASHRLYAIKTDGMPSGALWTWGNNQNGQLGDGTTTDRVNPDAVVQGVVGCAAGSWQGFALKADGTVLAWGANFNGQLGDGTTNDHFTPAPV